MQQLIDGRGEGGQGPFCRRGKRSGAIRRGGIGLGAIVRKMETKKGMGSFDE